MPLTDALLPEYDHEMRTTRLLLERLPEGRGEWRPHPKSMTLGRLATHLAELPGWVATILGLDRFDLAPPGAGAYEPRSYERREPVLRLFDEGVAQARAAIAACGDAEFMRPFTLQRGGREVLTLPKLGVVRTLLLNHLIHHRGQFSVFLRLNDVPLPSIYGPSADETG